ncbi:unnamed protein product [Notodromas monacha]|uniref:SH3 domain-containing protein n=1 Tax=Notodromas monacha TaxID=399045 RepID=A0A7R9BGJ2_9CRUS|nr:unnamed protein product [Notodromas monacha]CAG0913463.1 unnamed protein product [Notodromas monacha]
MASTREKNVPTRPAPGAPAFAKLRNLIAPDSNARSPSSRSSFYSDTNAKKNQKKPPPRPPPPKFNHAMHRSVSLERNLAAFVPQAQGYTFPQMPALIPPPVSAKPKLNQDLSTLIDLFSSPPPSSSSSSPTLTHHSGSDGFSVNSLTIDEDFDPFSPRSLASKQKDSFNKLRDDSALHIKPDSGLQRQYALLQGKAVTPPKTKKPTVIRNNRPTLAVKPQLLTSIPTYTLPSDLKCDRESSPPEPMIPPPKAPDVNILSSWDDEPPALPPRRPHSEEPFNTEEPHAIVLFDYERTHPDDLGCIAGEVVYLVNKVSEDWFTCRKRNGAEGLIPANFLDILEPLKPRGEALTALYSFPGEMNGDLAFPEGAIVFAEARINDEWLFGSYDGKSGQFPVNFVTVVTNNLPQHSSGFAMEKIAVGLFLKEFDASPTIAVAAPGRVNLIGEHTDYNGGFVLPMALPLKTVIVGRVVEGTTFTVVSKSVDSEEARVVFGTDKDHIERGLPKWANYVKGVCKFFPGNLKAVEVLIYSDVPLGAGLSSSAALEVATCTFLEASTGHKMSPIDKALLCQKAEHEFASVPCGIMDQFISSLGVERNALLIDCQSLSTKLVPLGNEASVFICDSNVKHDLGGSEYPKRSAQCKRASAILGKECLRDCSLDELEVSRELLDEETFRRVRHVVSEIQRTQDAVKALESQDFATFGRLMTESHASLRDDYEVSCKELDELVDLALEVDGVYGSRMTGGGFGGCTVTLVKKEAVDALKKHLNEKYSGNASFYVCEASRGATEIDIPVHQ